MADIVKIHRNLTSGVAPATLIEGQLAVSRSTDGSVRKIWIGDVGDIPKLLFDANEVAGHVLDSHTDINAPTPAHGQRLAWDEAAQLWIPKTSQSGLSILRFHYRMELPANPIPVAGQISRNNDNPLLATELYINEIDRDGSNESQFWGEIKAGDWFNIYRSNDANNHEAYDVIGPAVENGSTWIIPVAVYVVEGAGLSDNNDVQVVWRIGANYPHSVLVDRDAADCHPMSAISGLSTAVDGKVDKAGDTMTGNLIIQQIDGSPKLSLENSLAPEAHFDISFGSDGKVYFTITYVNAYPIMTWAKDLIISNKPIQLFADATEDMQVVTKQQMDAADDGKVNKTGDTMTGGLVVKTGGILAGDTTVGNFIDIVATKDSAIIEASGGDNSWLHAIIFTNDTVTFYAGNVLLQQNATAALGAVTKQQMDAYLKPHTHATGNYISHDNIIARDSGGHQHPIASIGDLDLETGDLQDALDAKVSKAGDTMTSRLVIDANATVPLRLSSSNSDYTYMEFYPRLGNLTTRGAYIGFINTGNTLQLACDIGDVYLNAIGGHVLVSKDATEPLGVVSLQQLDLDWITPNFNGTWAEDSTAKLRYRKLLDGTVQIQGKISGGTIGGNIFTLPAGYRPRANPRFPCPCNNGSMAYVQARSDSSLKVQYADVTGDAQAGIDIYISYRAFS